VYLFASSECAPMTGRGNNEIDRSIAALEQVYYEIAERQKRLYFTWALPANRAGVFEE
jgi:hypothetical protein